MLTRLYSDTNLLLKDVPFEPGINIILGKYSGNKEARGINGIGKSTLVRLIDFALLSEKAEKIFFSTKYDFLRKENHSITLEFEIKNKKYFISRNFDKRSEIYFGKTPNNLDKFEKTELKSVLTNLFFPITDNEIFFEGKRFRTLMNFFIKDDINHQKRFDPLNFIGAGLYSNEVSIYNFFLLNLPTKNLLNFRDIAKEFRDKSTAVAEIDNTIKAETGKTIDEFKSEKIKIENRISILEKSLKDYKFIENYKNIETHLIEITKKINQKLEEYHGYNLQLRKLRESYSQSQNVDTLQIQKLYNEAYTTFGDLVKKTLDEIISFKSEILENRNKFLVKKENQVQQKLKEILNTISVFEKERSELYLRLKEKGALASIENAYKDLISEKTNLHKINSYTEQSDSIKQIILDLESTLSDVKSDIAKDLDNFYSKIDKLRRLFQEILENAIFIEEDTENAYFEISKEIKNKKDQYPFKIKIEIPKAEALGQSRLKIIAYDLMVFLYNIRQERELPNFLIHDGVFHGISRKTMINAINYVFRQFNEHQNFQYILTFNEDEIESPKNKIETYGNFDFDWTTKVIAEYSDVKEKMIFKRIIS